MLKVVEFYHFLIHFGVSMKNFHFICNLICNDYNIIIQIL